MNTLAFTLGEHRSQLTLKISTYPNGNLAIKLYEKDHDILILWENLTTNLTGIRPDHCAFINIKAADGLFPVWLSDNHLAEPTGQILESDGCLYPEYLFNGKELDALDHEGHTLYIRRQKGELGRRFERLYLALRRLAREINGFSYTAKSVFSPEKRGLFLAEDVTSRYTRRSDREYDKIANYIHQTVSQRHGNYMVFFPSHVFLQQVYERYLRCYAVKDDTECLVQTEHMDEAEREAFLQRFEGNPGMNLSDIIHMEIEVEEESSLVGFCVLGGIFSEGIDLKEDSLIGALIVGTGLPQVCTEREIIRGYFEENGENGFDYAYRYPGMNKVLQAAGRVIRTADDVGIVALLDDRFLTPGYRRLFPREWEQFEVVRGESIGSRVEKFWNDWL